MKVVILAGGLGTRISEETDFRPKPMVEVGGKPILWHIMKQYSAAGFEEFVILLGYKGYMIKEYFSNYYLHQSDVTIDTANNSLTVLNNKSENWKVTLVDTGAETMTGGRVLRAKKYLSDSRFFLTYGDGVSNVDFKKQLKFHTDHGKAMTITSVKPEGRFGSISFDGTSTKVTNFVEKPSGDGYWINGGFFVCEPKLFDYLENDQTILERAPFENLSKDGQMHAYHHEGFWKCMDTLRDKQQLNQMWEQGMAKWKTW